jgi:xylan 1,4-beta-xylosidase
MWKQCVWVLLMVSAAGAQTAVRIDVDAGRTLGAYAPVWNYFGADEPNYATEADGRKLLRELAALPKGSPAPVYFRAHNLLTTGDGTGSLKWGSTNVYTEDAQGKAVYDWTVTDKIFDAYKAAGITPLVEVSFMPEALSTHPEPYRHTFPKGDIFTGWTYPPKDYAKWAALVQAWAGHLRDRYGAEAVKGWLWEVWNEPDIPYWHGTAEEYDTLYDYTADAIRKAVPEAKVGGPEMTGPGGEKGAAYLRSFLEHCAHGKNAATGGVGAPLAFVSFHPKGSPKVVDGHVRMGISNQLTAADNGFKVVAASAFKGLPVIMGEFDPEGCAACSGANLGYRNGPLYGVSVVEAEMRAQELARRDGVHLKGAVTWAFEFEGQPYFAGYRDLATNGIDKAVLNAFRMMGMLGGDWVSVSSDGAVGVDAMLKDGVRGSADVNSVATRKAREVDVLVWNYHDDDVATASAAVTVAVKGLKGKSVRVREFRMDAAHGNAYAAWLKMGSPQKPTAEQVAALEEAGKLAELGSLPGSESPDPGHPNVVAVKKGSAEVRMDLPRQGVELVRLSW